MYKKEPWTLNKAQEDPATGVTKRIKTFRKSAKRDRISKVLKYLSEDSNRSIDSIVLCKEFKFPSYVATYTLKELEKKKLIKAVGVKRSHQNTLKIYKSINSSDSELQISTDDSLLGITAFLIEKKATYIKMQSFKELVSKRKIKTFVKEKHGRLYEAYKRDTLEQIWNEMEGNSIKKN